MNTSGISSVFADKDAGTGKAVTVSSYALGGADAANYMINSGANTGSTTANITQANLTVTGIAANNKVYNGNTTATLSNNGSLTGTIYGSDTVTLNTSGIASAFADKNVGTGKSITVSSYGLTGTMLPTT